jgi:ketosteroid isomerase-like protein
MDPELEQRIRATYEAFARGDVEAVLANFDADSRVANPDYALEGGEAEGRQAAAATFQSTLDWLKLESIDVEEIAEGPDGVLVMIRLRGEGRASGVPVDVRYAHAIEYDVEGNRVQRFTWFETREEGLAAVGLS